PHVRPPARGAVPAGRRRAGQVGRALVPVFPRSPGRAGARRRVTIPGVSSVGRPIRIVSIVAVAFAAAACSPGAPGGEAPAADSPAIAVATVVVEEAPIARLIRVSGTLAAQDQAEVAAEIA